MEKAKIIDQILIVQQDFQALTDRSNALQHENQYFQAQLEDLENQLRARQNKEQQNQNYSIQTQQYRPQQTNQWPKYIRIESTLPQAPEQFVKYQGQNGKMFVQYLQLLQYTEPTLDGKGHQIVKQEYFAVQMPIEMFEAEHGPFEKIGMKGVEQNHQNN